MSFGLTKLARGALGTSGVVQTCATAYTADGYAAMIGMPVKSGAKKSVAKLGEFSVGAYKDLHGKIPGLDAHHVGQSALMKKMVPDYDHATAPAILVPLEGHTKRKGVLGVVSRNTGKGAPTTPRDVLARDLKEMRRVYQDKDNRINPQLQELSRMNKTMYPDSFKNPNRP